MAPESQEDAGSSLVRIGVCSTCRLLFLVSEDRQTSPCCGADPLVALATLTLGPGAAVTGAWGLTVEDHEAARTEEPAPAAAPLEEPPAEEEQEEEGSEGLTDTPDLGALIVEFLVGVPASGDELRDAFVAAGAEPERAANAVGRLEAVREELRRLEPPEEPEPAAPAAPEAEIPPENT